ncbi:MAG: dephospho-CoA kinase [Ruminococcaceae bacterium]|nr:dephospho-CoA kinase [Oscillospiraceae bacterium]
MSFPILGLTGPSGAGKSVVAQRLRDAHGFTWIDTDAVYHDLTSTPSPCLDELRAAFGDGVIKDGALHRPTLAAIVFAPDAGDKLELLNRITHKHVLAVTAQRIEDARQNGARGAIIDAPLLFESGADATCTHTLAVIADKETRLARIMARDNLSQEAAQKRLDAQKPDAYYCEKADFIIENNGDLQAMRGYADALAKELL